MTALRQTKSEVCFPQDDHHSDRGIFSSKKIKIFQKETWFSNGHIFKRFFWASKKFTSSKLICSAKCAHSCNWKAKTLSQCAYNPVNPVVCDHLLNELACSRLFIGNQWPLHTSACDCNDQRAYSSERDLTLSNELTDGCCVLKRSCQNTLTKVNCQLILLPWNDQVCQLVFQDHTPKR